MPEKYTRGGGEEQGFIEIWYNEHLSGQTLVSQQTIGLTEQLDQHQLEIILSPAHDLRALPLCYFYGVTQQFLIYIIGKLSHEFSCAIWNKFLKTDKF